jgi:predicted Zn-dependent protease
VQTLAAPDLIELPATGRRRGRLHWRAAALVVMAGAALAAGWQLARPVLAGMLAEAVVPGLEVRLGQGMLRELEAHALAPSALPNWRQQRIADALKSLQPPHEGTPPHRLLFRSGQAGATAFTLPSGDIVLTDALVLALPGDGAVLAVLAHELGHQQRRHVVRRLVQEAMLPAAVAVVLGDVDWLASSVAARAPQLAWPQEAEIEADDYAADLLQHNGLPLRSVAEVQEALSAAGSRPAYLALHPAGPERLAQQRERSAR